MKGTKTIAQKTADLDIKMSGTLEKLQFLQSLSTMEYIA